MPSFINKAIEFINKITPDALTLVFGHTGDGNIYYCVMQPQEGGLAKFKSLKSALTPSVNDLAISFNDGFLLVSWFKRVAVHIWAHSVLQPTKYIV